MELQEYIAKRRKELKISQSEIASALGYTDTAVSKIESGASSLPISILPALANVLHLSLNDLFAQKKDPAPLKELNPPYDWKKVSLNLRAVRLANHLRQKEAAEKIGISKRTLVTYEKGDACPNLAVMLKLLPLCPGQPADFFYSTLYPEIQSSPSFQKRGPSPFLLLFIGLFAGAGIVGAILGPRAASAQQTSSGLYQFSLSSSDSSEVSSEDASSVSSSAALIPYLDELAVIGPDGIGMNAAMKPNSQLRVGVYTGQNYTEQMRKKTHFDFSLEYYNPAKVTMTADPTCYPCQIIETGDITLGSLDASFTVTVTAWLDSDPTVRVQGAPLDITVNDTGTLTD
jgi:transcriptional regulator with XRE-family HTH domain